MEERLNLGIPSSNADAPKKRFEFKEEPSRSSSIMIPFFVAAWAALLKQFMTEEKEHTKPELKPGPNTPFPIQDSDVETEIVDRPIRGGSSAVDVARVIAIAWMPEGGGAESFAIEPSNLQFVRTPAPPLRPSLDQGDFGLRPAKAGNDNHQSSPSGGGGGGGGGGGDGSPEGRGGSSPPTKHPGSGEGAETPSPSNRRPALSGPVYLNNGLVNQSIIITIGELLTGASDPDGDRLVVQSLTADSGTLEQLGPERWLFTPARDEAGPVTLHYEVTDGKETVSQSAYSEFLPRHGDDIRGTDGDDILIGTPLNDVLDARGGNDVVYGRESDDAIRGGDGNDRLIGGDGDDIIWGDAGNDVIFGGAGNDTLFGEDGDDDLFGEDGSDLLFGGAGDDVLNGGNGDDRLDGDAGVDQLSGEAGNDRLDGGADADHLDGGSGNDVLLGGAGNDGLSGSDGNDKAFGGDGDDYLDGGDGDDYLDGGDGDDHLDGGDGDDVIDAGSGSNTVDAGSGDDIVLISPIDGSDVVIGGAGNDTVDLQDIVFDSTVNLPDGLVIVDGVDRAQIFEIESIRGGHGRDHLIADDHANIMVGGEGNDTFTFETLASLTNNGGPRDHVTDFRVGDRLDLSSLGQELDEFAGKKLFFVEASSASFDEIGAVTYRHEIVSEGQEITVVTGNLDGDPEAEFEIVLDGHHDLTQADFILEVTAQNSGIQQPC